MKIAIFHNFMDNIGGAEMVALYLARGLDADIYTTSLDIEKIKLMGFDDVVPRIKSIGRVPVNAPFRQQLALWKFRRLNLGNQYDFYIIAGDWAMSAVVNHHPNLWYIHSPLNELWQFKNYIREELLTFWKRPLYDIFVWFNRRLTRHYAKKVDVWVCNSKNTQKRTERFYNHTPVIISPPIDTKNYEYKPHKNYWLSVNRLLAHKRIDIQMKAFAMLPDEKLIVVGSYEKGARQFEKYKEMIDKIQPANVEILHFVDNVKLQQLYAECKGFIATSRDEDAGMAIVEAMASGKPAIAANEGGYKESMIQGVTGILIDDIDEHKLATVVRDIGPKTDSYRDACIARAKEFDISVFVEKIKDFINRKNNLGKNHE